MSPRAVAVSLAVAAVVVAAGGAFGYARRGSVDSIAVAGAAGAIWLACAVGVARGAGWARGVAAAVAVALALLMAWRWANGASPGVAAPVLVVAAAVLAVLALSRRRPPEASRP